MGHQIVFHSGLWVANYHQLLRTTAVDDYLLLNSICPLVRGPLNFFLSLNNFAQFRRKILFGLLALRLQRVDLRDHKPFCYEKALSFYYR